MDFDRTSVRLVGAAPPPDHFKIVEKRSALVATRHSLEQRRTDSCGETRFWLSRRSPDEKELRNDGTVFHRGMETSIRDDQRGMAGTDVLSAMLNQRLDPKYGVYRHNPNWGIDVDGVFYLARTMTALGHHLYIRKDELHPDIERRFVAVVFLGGAADFSQAIVVGWANERDHCVAQHSYDDDASGIACWRIPFPYLHPIVTLPGLRPDLIELLKR